jgi:hypothetical protein
LPLTSRLPLILLSVPTASRLAQAMTFVEAMSQQKKQGEAGIVYVNHIHTHALTVCFALLPPSVRLCPFSDASSFVTPHSSQDHKAPFGGPPGKGRCSPWESGSRNGHGSKVGASCGPSIAQECRPRRARAVTFQGNKESDAADGL